MVCQFWDDQLAWSVIFFVNTIGKRLNEGKSKNCKFFHRIVKSSLHMPQGVIGRGMVSLVGQHFKPECNVSCIVCFRVVDGK